MSSIFKMLSGLGGTSGAAGPSGQSILMRAIGAAMRGESAQSFMYQLANEIPELKGIDTNNLMASADKLAKEKGVDVEQMKTQIDTAVNNAMNK